MEPRELHWRLLRLLFRREGFLGIRIVRAGDAGRSPRQPSAGRRVHLRIRPQVHPPPALVHRREHVHVRGQRQVHDGAVAGHAHGLHEPSRGYVPHVHRSVGRVCEYPSPVRGELKGLDLRLRAAKRANAAHPRDVQHPHDAVRARDGDERARSVQRRGDAADAGVHLALELLFAKVPNANDAVYEPARHRLFVGAVRLDGAHLAAVRGELGRLLRRLDRVHPVRLVRHVPDGIFTSSKVELPTPALVLGDTIRSRLFVLSPRRLPRRTRALEHPAVLPGLKVKPVNLAALVAYDGKVTARGHRHRRYREPDPVRDAELPFDAHLRRGLKDVLAEDAVGETPRVRARFPGVTRHHVGPIPFPHLAPRHAPNRRELQLLLGDSELLRASLDVRLAQLLRLLVLYRAEHSQRPVVARGQDAKALAVKLDVRRGRAVPGSESKEPPRAVGVVEDPLLERVVGAARHQHRLAEEEVRLGHGAVVRSGHDGPKAPLLQVPDADGAGVAAHRYERVLVAGGERHRPDGPSAAVVGEVHHGPVDTHVLDHHASVTETDRDGVERGRLLQARHRGSRGVEHVVRVKDVDVLAGVDVQQENAAVGGADEHLVEVRVGMADARRGEPLRHAVLAG